MKVVINACFGGFSLSPRAVAAYAKRKGRPCYFFEGGMSKPYTRVKMPTDTKGVFGPTAFDVPEVPVWRAWTEQTKEEQRAQNEWWTLHCIDNRPDDRADPDLVAVVEKLGAKADGACARLKVVEVPDGVEWEIDEYDGNEHIAEKHRTWG